MQYTYDFWFQNAHLSGEQLGETLGIDGGSARRLIRAAKREFPVDRFPEIPWYTVNPNRETPVDVDTEFERLGLIPPPDAGPAILFYDIETAPALAWIWAQWNTNAIAIESDWYMLSFAYKWLNQKEMGFVSIAQDPAFFPDTVNDKYVAERLAALFDRCDVSVAHNGDRFDRRKANQRFLKWDIDPPSPYQTIDTKKVAAREFAHMSNKLAELGRIHEIGDKEHHTGFELWRECMRGNMTFWKTMEKYNRKDVDLLEQVYLKLLPWIGLPGKPTGVNFGFWDKGRMVCPNCGHDKLTQKGTHRTLVSEFPTYQCARCRTFSRFRKRTPQPDGGVQLV